MKNLNKTILYPLLILLLTVLAVFAFYGFSQRGNTITIVDKNNHQVKSISPAQASKTSRLGH
ncbi:hypothetical protein [Oenococcus sicerae]|uniref:Uncharacterized protein n=1 Tax=Oenococcus sicerae TaxID=2203724 RepID=A0AAJ1VNB9_9LACO|nr:hypothetical protein [Oenococcus sicerae]MDN6900591.1 hypothetical protein [Oenococcus sicerae]